LDALPRVRDAVEGKEIDDVALLEADPAQLHPADLRFRTADRVARLLPGDATGLPQAPQLGAEEHPGHGGSGGRAVIVVSRRHWSTFRVLTPSSDSGTG